MLIGFFCVLSTSENLIELGVVKPTFPGGKGPVTSHVHTVQTNVDKSDPSYCDNNTETLDEHVDLTKKKRPKT